MLTIMLTIIFVNIYRCNIVNYRFIDHICEPWCWNIYQHLPEQNHPVMLVNIQCGAPKIAFSWFITPITMVDGTHCITSYNYSIHGVFVNQRSHHNASRLGAPRLVPYMEHMGITRWPSLGCVNGLFLRMPCQFERSRT